MKVDGLTNDEVKSHLQVYFYDVLDSVSVSDSGMHERGFVCKISFDLTIYTLADNAEFVLHSAYTLNIL